KVLLACSQCGSAHHENAVICPACRQPFASPLDPQAAWRKELAARFEAYRSRRRGRVGEEEGQKSLPFLPAPNGVGGGASGPAGLSGIFGGGTGVGSGAGCGHASAGAGGFGGCRFPGFGVLGFSGDVSFFGRAADFRQDRTRHPFRVRLSPLRAIFFSLCWFRRRHAGDEMGWAGHLQFWGRTGHPAAAPLERLWLSVFRRFPFSRICVVAGGRRAAHLARPHFSNHLDGSSRSFPTMSRLVSKQKLLQYRPENLFAAL